MIFNIQGQSFKASLNWCGMTQCIYDEHDNLIMEVPYDRDWYEVAEIAIRAHLRNQRLAA